MFLIAEDTPTNECPRSLINHQHLHWLLVLTLAWYGISISISIGISIGISIRIGIGISISISISIAGVRFFFPLFSSLHKIQDNSTTGCMSLFTPWGDTTTEVFCTMYKQHGWIFLAGWLWIQKGKVLCIMHN